MAFITLPVSAAEAPAFRDVVDNSWYASAVKTVCDVGLMIGKGDGVFDPDGQVTGAEAVTIATRVHSILTTGSTEVADHYYESTDEPWYWNYVTYAARYFDQEHLGVYDVPASRRLYARMLASAVGDALEEINEVAKNAIPDLEENFLSEGIYRLYRTGILTGNDEKGTFLPDAPIRRSEAAAIAARILDPELRKSVTLTEAAYRFDTTFIVPGGWFTLTVPDWWEGEVLMWPCVNGNGEDKFRMDFYCRLEVERTKFGGLLGSVGIRPHKDDRIWQWPVMEIATVTYPDGQTYDVTLHFPSDVQYYLPEPADYERASNSLRSVVAAMQFPEGCEVIWLTDTTSLELTYQMASHLYDQAREVFAWYYLGLMSVDYSKTVNVNGQVYYQVVDERLQGRFSVEGVRNYLEDYFSGDFVETLFQESPCQFIEKDDILYAGTFGGGGNPFIRKERLEETVKKLSDTKYTITMYAEILNSDLEVTGKEIEYKYTLVYENGRWVFNTFQLP